MTALMATEPKPVRLVVNTDDELREAVRLEAAKQGMEMSELVDATLRQQFAESLAEVRRRRSGDDKRKK